MYSLTQAGNIGQLIGLVLSLFGHNVAPEAIDGFLTVLGAIISIGGLAVSWIGRYRKGDVTLGGWKK